MPKPQVVLGINPPVFDFAWFDLWARPLGLLYHLQEWRERGAEVFLIDCLAEARTKALSFGRFEVTRREVAKPVPYRHILRRYWHFGMEENAFLNRLAALPKPDLICVTSGMTYWYPGIRWVIDRVRQVFPHVPIHLGGIYARLAPEHAQTLGADHVEHAPGPPMAPFPAWDLYDDPGALLCATSWGCPLGCVYCASHTLFPGFTQRPHNAVVDELARTTERFPDLRDVAICDDALLLGKEQHFLPLFARLRQRFPHLRLHAPNGLHLREIDAKCATALYETGFVTLRLSLESVDPVVQAESANKAAKIDFEQAVTNLLKTGFRHEQLETYLLVGLPGQRIEGIRDSIAFVKELGCKPKLAEYSPIPGTALWEEALRLSPGLQKEPLLANNTVWGPWIAGTLTPDVLQGLKDEARR